MYALLYRVPGIGIKEENNAGSYLIANAVFLSGLFSFAAVLGACDALLGGPPACWCPPCRRSQGMLQQQEQQQQWRRMQLLSSRPVYPPPPPHRLHTHNPAAGIVSDEIKSAFKAARSGNYPVRVSNHILLLNWNPQTLAVLRQLASAEVRRRSGGGRLCVYIRGSIQWLVLEACDVQARSGRTFLRHTPLPIHSFNKLPSTHASNGNIFLPSASPNCSASFSCSAPLPLSLPPGPPPPGTCGHPG